MRFSLIALTLLLGGCATQAPVLPPSVPALHSESVGVARKAQTLFVVVHGDGVQGTAIDVSDFARSLAAAVPGSAVVRLMRPGYADSAGNQSPGVRGRGVGDDYTPERLGVIGDNIQVLRARYPGARVIAIGEGGGAAVIANIAGLRPSLFDGMVLVSCPCALPEWRRYMAGREKPPAPWREKVASLDPLQTAGGIAPTLRAAILSGANDKSVPFRFARSYAEALSLRGIATEFRIIPDGGSHILNDPQVIDAARRLADSLPRKAR